MAQPREAAFNPSSPHSSSGGADSYKHEGTPDTRLTAFSPDEGSAKSSKLLNALNLSASKAHRVRFPIESYRTEGVHQDKDPFVTTLPTSKPQQKLSPTASAFRPFSTPLVANGSGEATPKPEAARPADTQQSLLPVSSALSTDLLLSRCIEISAPSSAVPPQDIDLYLLKFDHLGSPFIGQKQVQCRDGKAYLLFTDLRDACMVHRNVKIGNPDWTAGFVSPTLFAQSAPGSATATCHDGQISFLALLPPGLPVVVAQVEAMVFSHLQAEGDLFAFQRQSGFGDSIARAVLEFYDTEVAHFVLSKYNGLTIEGFQIALSPYKPEEAVMSQGGHGEIASPSRAPVHDLVAALQNVSLTGPQPQSHSMLPPTQQMPLPLGLQIQAPYALYHPLVYRGQFPAITPLIFDSQVSRPHSTSSSTSSPPFHGSAYAQVAPAPLMPLHQDFGSARSAQTYHRQDGRRQNAMRVNRSPYYNAAGHHNHVDVNRIREGIDVRTTIMLRNIPNKVDQAMLKRIVDESSWGKYDFMYLRIDFANDCNVGYAFINFVDPLDIIDFVNARGNQRWNCFKSDKVAEISYATIQGKDCLVQKFRNSSVMLEAEHYRPKLYYTSNGPMPELAGQEEPFPGPDNQSKMKRSCENAEHVGLFTPNAGQHFRDEQRRRRSQYDRGTRLAALEEYDYEAALRQLYTAH